MVRIRLDPEALEGKPSLLFIFFTCPIFHFRFCVAEQAINAIYLLADHPDILCGDIIKKMAGKSFGVYSQDIKEDKVDADVALPGNSITAQQPDFDKGLGDESMDSDFVSLIGDGEEMVMESSLKITADDAMSSDLRPETRVEVEKEEQEKVIQDSELPSTVALDPSYSGLESSTESSELSRLFFVVGHVAIKQVVHFEKIETEWKRRRALDEDLRRLAKLARKSTGDLDGGDELEQVTGSVEDEFTDQISGIRERELLFGKSSLLTLFGGLISHVAANNIIYTVSEWFF